MLAALAVTPSASAPRVKLLCSATATKTRRLASGARRYAARGAAAALERRETRSAAAGDCGGIAAFFRLLVSRVGTGRCLGNHPQVALIIRPSRCALSGRVAARESSRLSARRPALSLQRRLTTLQLL